MRRRERHQDSSLELLLDTVCNAFGGIIFIVLLLAVIPQGSGSPSAQSASDQQIAQLRQLQADVLAKQRQVELHRLVADGMELDESAAEVRTREELAQRRDRLRAAVAAANRTEHELELELAQVQREQVRLEQLQERLETALLQAEHLRAVGEQRHTRLPRLRAVPGKRNIFIALKAGRLYVTVNGGLLHTPNEHDFDVTEEPGRTVYMPRAGQGNLCATWVSKGLPAFAEEYPDARYVVNLCVYPDSTSGFSTIRTALAKSGYDYNWYPMGESEPLVLVQTTASAEAQ